MDDAYTFVRDCLQTLLQQGTVSRIDAPFVRELVEAEEFEPPQIIVAARLLYRYQHHLGALDLAALDENTLLKWAIQQPDALSLDDASAEMTLKLEMADLIEIPPAEEVHTFEALHEGSIGSDVLHEGTEEKPLKRVSVQGDRLFVEFPFDRKKVAAVQPLKETVDDWAFDRFHRKEWSYPLSAALTVYLALREFRDLQYTLNASALVKREFRREALARRVRAVEERQRMLEQFAALEAVRVFIDGGPVANGQRLFRHQREAVQRMIEALQGRFILAHDMGLGKSRSSLIAAQAYDLPIWVVAPAGTLINWQREAAAAGVEIVLYSWAKLPEPREDENYVLITDEAHYAQAGEETVRGRGFLQLADKARAVYMLSGTPIKNGRPINLWPLLVAARHPLATDRRSFENRYCDPSMRSIGRKKAVLDVSGASNLDELHERTRDVILYKKKKECIDLPDKLRVKREAEVKEAGRKLYQQTVARLWDEHIERMEDKRAALQAAMDTLLGEGAEESHLQAYAPADAQALVELGIYRHAASLAKVDPAAGLAQDALEEGQGVLLFCAFRASAERLASKLSADLLTGEVSKIRRQAMIDRFQAGESKVLVATIGAGGIGINLTAAQVVIMVDRGWTPAEAEQAEDRAYRIGQHHNVTSVWLQYGAIDEKIDQLLELKQERIDTILRGKKKHLRGVPGVRAFAKEIIESITTGKSLAELLGLDEADFEQPVVDLVRDPEEVEQADSGTEASAPARKSRPARRARSLRRSVKADGTPDRRFKGNRTRIRMNIMLDEEVAAFLRSLKTNNQRTTVDSGYSGFLEEQVRESEQFQRWREQRRQRFRASEET
jgi:hypothetical protein